MNEGEMVNGAGRIERNFPGVRCDWRRAEDVGWGVAVFDRNDGRYICSIFSTGLIRDTAKVAVLLGLAGIEQVAAPNLGSIVPQVDVETE